MLPLWFSQEGWHQPLSIPPLLARWQSHSFRPFWKANKVEASLTLGRMMLQRIGTTAEVPSHQTFQRDCYSPPAHNFQMAGSSLSRCTKVHQSIRLLPSFTNLPRLSLNIAEHWTENSDLWPLTGMSQSDVPITRTSSAATKCHVLSAASKWTTGYTSPQKCLSTSNEEAAHYQRSLNILPTLDDNPQGTWPYMALPFCGQWNPSHASSVKPTCVWGGAVFSINPTQRKWGRFQHWQHYITSTLMFSNIWNRTSKTSLYYSPNTVITILKKTLFVGEKRGKKQKWKRSSK